jgi:site-specific DNA-methyltransferase (cytosine-N4-specific)
MLTDEDDMVMDIFAGSNTTGFVAEALNRKWLAFELEKEFLISSIFRFLDGHDFEEVKNTLEKLDNKHAGYQLHDIQCLFEQVKEQKTKGLNKGQIPLF